jgi:hypothetical protein
MREKEKFFLTVELQQVNVEGMMEIENHLLAAIIVEVDLGKNCQRIPRLVGGSFYM